jgi:hypothetical protein
MRKLKWISGALWGLSWFFLYREIFVWHHVTTSLRFNPPPPPPGTTLQPHAGEFLIAVMVGSALAPLVFLTTVIMDWAHRRPISSPAEPGDEMV